MRRPAAWTALAAIALVGLALFLWGAMTAPVVTWSDSEADMVWAREGLGILRPVPLPASGPLGHQPKPAYLLFLRAAMRAFPQLGEMRSVVVAQSLILWGAIAAASLWIGLRRSPAQGALVALLGFSFLRLRDASSAVMPEALAAAFLIVLAAFFAEPPRRPAAFVFLGFATAVLFYVRPNCGAAMLLLGIVGLAVSRRGASLLALVAGFAFVVVPFSMEAQPAPPGDPFQGLGYQVLEASAEYYWTPSLGAWPSGGSPKETALAEFARARENWKTTLAEPGSDSRREIVWRALHGLLGTEFYDARWSEAYRRATAAVRLAFPFLAAVAIAALLLAPAGRDGPGAKAMGWLLLAAIAGQSLLLGPNPRFALPFLLPLLLLAAVAAADFAYAGSMQRGAAVLVFVVLLALLLNARHVLDWQWGQVESAGIRVEQQIPRGALPRTGPAVLHARIAPPLPASSAGLAIYGPGARLLYESHGDAARQRPLVTVPLPDWLLEANRREPVALTFVSTGEFGKNDYLLFPVIPPPWGGDGARREGTATLSPATGIASGALDWWAHEGTQ